MAGPRPLGRVAVLAPMRSELRPFTRLLSLRREQLGDVPVHRGRAGGSEIVATMIGVGTRSARESTERLLAALTVDHVVVIGIAGGVGPDSRIGEVFVPAIVRDRATGTDFRSSPFGDVDASGTLLTTEDLLVDEDLLAPLRDQGLVGLDMETAAVADVCERHAVPWTAYRAISDRPTDGMVDQAVFGMMKPDGSPNLKAVGRYVVRRPWALPRLARLGRDANTAAGNAARAAVNQLTRP